MTTKKRRRVSIFLFFTFALLLNATMAQAQDGEDMRRASVSELLGLRPIGPKPDNLDEPKKLATVHATSSPDSCERVRKRLDILRNKGVERVTCIAANPTGSTRSQAAPAAASQVWCESGERNQWWATRRGICVVHDYVMQIIDPKTGKETGRATYLIKQELNFRDTLTSPTKVQEFTSVTLVNQVNEATNNSMNWDSGCVGCSISHSEPWSGYATFSKGQTRERRWDWDVPIEAGGVEQVDWGWELKTRAGGVEIAEPYEWGGGIAQARCDNQVAGNFGCITPLIDPTLPIDYATRQAGATLVAVGSQVNNHWWGWEEKKKPLTRLSDEDLAEANRDIICPDDFETDPAVPGGSCDEYPFARTYQSRDNGTIYNGDHCQQLTSGQLPNGDWDLFTIDGNWDPNAPCLRATTPLDHNRLVGGDLGRFTQEARLLDRDKYYVLVYDSRLS